VSRARGFVVLGLLLGMGNGCAPTHIKTFAPRHRKYEAGTYAQASPDASPGPGSLYSDARPGLLQDTRALHVGDIVVITIDEQADAKGDATTKLGKSTDRTAGATAVLGILPALKRLNPEMDTSKLLEMAAQSNFAGNGATTRTGALSGSIAVRVSKQQPNGDFYIEGTKVVMINNEEYHLYVSGLVRWTDVKTDNTVASSRIADAQIEFTGRGDMADQQERGFLSKALDTINPF
jgi:flagellar L-ring protein precursor FlgH